MPPISLRLLQGERSEMRELQRVFEGAPTYSERIAGGPPGPAEAQSTFTILPPGKGYEDRFVYGIFLDGDPGQEMIGCIDLIRGYPERGTAMLGLLLISEKSQGKGYGREALRLVEDRVRAWTGINRIRIGVVATNSEVLAFWKKMGFNDTGERKPYKYGRVGSETLILEKPVTGGRTRHTMRIALKNEPLPGIHDLRPVRPVTPGDTGILGKLMERAYLGTIDDEGESLRHHIDELTATIRGKYGPFIPEASFWIEEEAQAIAMSVVTLFREKPLLAFVVSSPLHQRQGLATFLIRKSLNTMAGMGYREIFLGVTEGNEAARRLYAKLGFRLFQS